MFWYKMHLMAWLRDAVNAKIQVTIHFPMNSAVNIQLQSVSWSLPEFRHNKIVQSPHENYFNVCRQHKEK